MYRKVLAKWGWQANAPAAEQLEKVKGMLASGAPWLEPVGMDATEDMILKQHLDGKGTPDTWFALARLRMNANKMGLARLTFLNALSQTPDSGRILNSVAVMTDGAHRPPNPRYSV